MAPFKVLFLYFFIFAYWKYVLCQNLDNDYYYSIEQTSDEPDVNKNITKRSADNNEVTHVRTKNLNGNVKLTTLQVLKTHNPLSHERNNRSSNKNDAMNENPPKRRLLSEVEATTKEPADGSTSTTLIDVFEATSGNLPDSSTENIVIVTPVKIQLLRDESTEKIEIVTSVRAEEESTTTEDFNAIFSDVENDTFTTPYFNDTETGEFSEFFSDEEFYKTPMTSSDSETATTPLANESETEDVSAIPFFVDTNKEFLAEESAQSTFKYEIGSLTTEYTTSTLLSADKNQGSGSERLVVEGEVQFPATTEEEFFVTVSGPEPTQVAAFGDGQKDERKDKILPESTTMSVKENTDNDEEAELSSITKNVKEDDRYYEKNVANESTTTEEGESLKTTSSYPYFTTSSLQKEDMLTTVPKEEIELTTKVSLLEEDKFSFDSTVNEETFSTIGTTSALLEEDMLITESKEEIEFTGYYSTTKTENTFSTVGTTPTLHEEDMFTTKPKEETTTNVESLERLQEEDKFPLQTTFNEEEFSTTGSTSAFYEETTVANEDIDSTTHYYDATLLNDDKNETETATNEEFLTTITYEENILTTEPNEELFSTSAISFYNSFKRTAKELVNEASSTTTLHENNDKETEFTTTMSSATGYEDSSIVFLTTNAYKIEESQQSEDHTENTSTEVSITLEHNEETESQFSTVTSEDDQTLHRLIAKSSRNLVNSDNEPLLSHTEDFATITTEPVTLENSEKELQTVKYNVTEFTESKMKEEEFTQSSDKDNKIEFDYRTTLPSVKENNEEFYPSTSTEYEPTITITTTISEEVDLTTEKDEIKQTTSYNINETSTSTSEEMLNDGITDLKTVDSLSTTQATLRPMPLNSYNLIMATANEDDVDEIDDISSFINLDEDFLKSVKSETKIEVLETGRDGLIKVEDSKEIDEIQSIEYEQRKNELSFVSSEIEENDLTGEASVVVVSSEIINKTEEVVDHVDVEESTTLTVIENFTTEPTTRVTEDTLSTKSENLITHEDIVSTSTETINIILNNESDSGIDKEKDSSETPSEEMEETEMHDPQITAVKSEKTIRFSVKVLENESSFFIPPDAHATFYAEDSMNVTWKSSLETLNNSLWFDLKNFGKLAQLNIVKGNQMQIHKTSRVSKPLTENKLQNGETRVITLDDGIRVSFSNLEFLNNTTNKKEIEPETQPSTPNQQTIAAAAEILGGCIGAFVIIGILVYYSVKIFKNRSDKFKPNSVA